MPQVTSGRYIRYRATGNPYLEINDTIRVRDRRSNIELIYYIDDFEISFTTDEHSDSIEVNKLLTTEIFEIAKKETAKSKSEIGEIKVVNADGTYDVRIKGLTVNRRRVPPLNQQVYAIGDRVLIDYMGGQRLRPVISGRLNSGGEDDQFTYYFDTPVEQGVYPPDLVATGQDGKVELEW